MLKFLIFQVSRLFVKGLFKFYFRVEFIGTENIPTSGSMIVAPNHVSFFDPLWVSAPITRPLNYMTWEKFVGIPFLGALIRYYGAFPVRTSRQDKNAFLHSLNHLKSGGSLMLFPEGARTLTGRLTKFNPGVIRFALEAKVPILPVTVIGGYRAFSPHHRFPRPYKVKIVYHEPIELSEQKDGISQKQYMREEALRLQNIVASSLPPEALPLSEQEMIET